MKHDKFKTLSLAITMAVLSMVWFAPRTPFLPGTMARPNKL